MNIVKTLGGLECGIHGFHIESTIRQLGMAGGAGGSRLLAMSLTAGETTKPLMNTDCGAIVPGARLSIGERRLALVTESLANVRADSDISIPVTHCGQWKSSERHVVELSPVEQRERWTEEFLARARIQTRLVMAKSGDRGKPCRCGRKIGKCRDLDLVGDLGVRNESGLWL